MRLRLLMSLPLVIVALAGCGDDERGSVEESGGTSTTGTTGTGTSTTPKPSGASVAEIDVKETDFALDPKDPRIAKAGVVTFNVENAGKAPHALEVEGPTGEVETETLQPGDTATLKADLSKAGTYKWYCPVGDHEARGMKGTITVAGGGSGRTTDDSGGRGGRGGDDSGKSDSSKRGSSGKGGVY